MITLTPIPAFNDNYFWCLDNGRDAIVVDPGDHAPVTVYLQQRGLQLSAVLVTHHHADHVGGLPELCAAWPELVVYGPAFESIAHVTQSLAEQDSFELSELACQLAVYEVPGHTRGHIAYVGRINSPLRIMTAAGTELMRFESAPPVLFCGDTLFGAGCGRLFEGTPAQMWRSLQHLAALPDETLVCCAHEYTLSNLRFAVYVDAANSSLHVRQKRDQQLRDDGLPTLPSTIGVERATNPFLRADQPALQEFARGLSQHDAGMEEPIATFAVLRQLKNEFR
jgi:hydroxyacylglutathione hydrolase